MRMYIVKYNVQPPKWEHFWTWKDACAPDLSQWESLVFLPNFLEGHCERPKLGLALAFKAAWAASPDVVSAAALRSNIYHDDMDLSTKTLKNPRVWNDCENLIAIFWGSLGQPLFSDKTTTHIIATGGPFKTFLLGTKPTLRFCFQGGRPVRRMYMTTPIDHRSASSGRSQHPRDWILWGWMVNCTVFLLVCARMSEWVATKCYQGYSSSIFIHFPHADHTAKGLFGDFGALSFRSFRCQPWHHNVGRRPPEPHTARNRPQLRFPGTGHLPLRPLRSLRLRQWFSAPRQMQGNTAQNQPEPIPRLRKTMKTKGDFQNAQHTLNIVLYIYLYIYIYIYIYIYLYIFIYIYIYIYMCVCLKKKSIYLSICLSVYLSIYLSIYLPIYLPTYLPIYLSIYLSIYLIIYTVCE